MKLNKRGFVASALLYSLLLLFLALILGLLALLSNRKQILDKLKNDIKDNINKVNTYEKYENGTVIYYNPVSGKLCGDYKEENSNTGVKDGCLKWYIFNDNENSATVNMILDHNTTALVAWNSSGNNAEMKEVKTSLETDTANWKDKSTARLITADEIAHIVGADKADTIKWNSSKTSGTDDIETKASWFYLDGTGTTYSNTDGWQKPVANSTTKSKYAWLYDNTYDCKSHGCNTSDDNKYAYGTEGETNNIYGYWTSTPTFDVSDGVWRVYRNGILEMSYAKFANIYGVRPVITISKQSINTYEKYENGTVIYYNPVSGKLCGDYKEENSNTGVKDGCLKWYIFNDNENSATVNMILDHNTTALVAWNSSGNNTEMNEVKTALESDTTNWKDKATARLITADEVAHIVGADKDDTIKWNSSKTYEDVIDDIETQVSWIYLDGTGTTYSNTDGWQKQVATSQGASKYAWLFDNTKECTSRGCNIADSSNEGYWTSTPMVGISNRAWCVLRYGSLDDHNVDSNSNRGVRPVITISKQSINTYEKYENGTVIYYNPVSGKLCGDYKGENSNAGIKEGCLKWYIFNDNRNSATVNMILDHNTTALVAWNSSGNSAEMKEVKTSLETDTTNWKDKATARLITADEIAHIVGADKADTIKWNSSKTLGTDDIETKASWFYLDGSGTTYSSTDGWQKPVANSTTKSKYAWLFDNTRECTSYGCNTADSSNDGYWTSTSTPTSVVGNSLGAWDVTRNGLLISNKVDLDNYRGVRPVITISKQSIMQPIISSKNISIENNTPYLNVVYNVDNIKNITNFECILNDTKTSSSNSTCKFPLTDKEVSICVTSKYGKNCSEPKSLVTYLIKDGTMLVDFSTKNASGNDTATLTKKTNYLNMKISPMEGTRQGIYTSNPIDFSLYEKVYVDSSLTVTVSSSSATNPGYSVALAEYPDVIDKTAKFIIHSSYYSKKNVTNDNVVIERNTRILDVKDYTGKGYITLRKNISNATINTNIYNIYMLKE